MSPARLQRLLAAWAVLTLGLAVRAFGRGLLGEDRGADPTLRALTLDLNRASVAELSTLPGVGPARAEAIVLDRIRRGAFGGVEELARVDGLGPWVVAQVGPFVRCGPVEVRAPP